MRSTLNDLARSQRLADTRKKRGDGRVSEAQWQLQLVATVQLSLYLGFMIEWRGRRRHHSDMQAATRDVTRICHCFEPPGWHPVDPAIGHGIRLDQIRYAPGSARERSREAIEELLREVERGEIDGTKY